MALVPESIDEQESLDRDSYEAYGLEATQLSQPLPETQASQFANSQVEPRRKYWAILIPTNSQHSILKLPWAKPRLQIGRGAHSSVKNDVVLTEKRVSNRHAVITLGLHATNGSAATQSAVIEQMKEGEAEPEVWIEDLKSSNGTFVNGERLRTKRMLIHGDEVSLGHQETLANHDVRYIFRSVGHKGKRMEEPVGEVYERYQMLATLGKGTFAEVKKAVDVETGDLRAIKQIVKHRFGNNPKTLELFQREIDICQQLTHDNICRLLESYQDPQHICLVLEYIDGGDLLDYIMDYKGDGLPEEEAADLTYQICRAMAYCHENGITHRDLKPENILLTKDSSSQGRMIKIADFGLAKMVQEGTMLKSMVGTPQYLAPEIVMQTRQKPGYENVVDSWSIGCIVYSMLTKALPFDDNSELTMEQRIRARYEMDFDRQTLEAHGISEQAVDFISRLLEKDPSRRMTMAQALEHEWLAGPSSLPNESQSQALGGDSMWNIQSFDSIDFDDERSDIDMEATAWTRPQTVSMTNYGDSNHESGDESFSQPMEKLRIHTAMVGSSLASADEREEAAAMDPVTPPRDKTVDADAEDDDVTNTPLPRANGHLDTPKQTARPVQVDADPEPSPTKDVVMEDAVPSKRKLAGDSTSDLSSPPESQEAAPAPLPDPEPPVEPPRRITRASTRQGNTQSPKTSPPKANARGGARGGGGARPRKSMRRA